MQSGSQRAHFDACSSSSSSRSSPFSSGKSNWSLKAQNAIDVGEVGGVGGVDSAECISQSIEQVPEESVVSLYERFRAGGRRAARRVAMGTTRLGLKVPAELLLSLLSSLES
jgi:hypothetical protein